MNMQGKMVLCSTILRRVAIVHSEYIVLIVATVELLTYSTCILTMLEPELGRRNIVLELS